MHRCHPWMTFCELCMHLRNGVVVPGAKQLSSKFNIHESFFDSLQSHLLNMLPHNLLQVARQHVQEIGAGGCLVHGSCVSQFSLRSFRIDFRCMSPMHGVHSWHLASMEAIHGCNPWTASMHATWMSSIDCTHGCNPWRLSMNVIHGWHLCMSRMDVIH